MIRVLIERHIAETLESAYEDRSRKVLQNAVSAPGFVSGETLVDTTTPTIALPSPTGAPKPTGSAGSSQRNAGN